MANSLRFTLRNFYLPLKRDVLKLSTPLSSQTTRHLYAKSTLGLDNFSEHKQNIKNQMENIEERFREKMQTYAADSMKGMIFTEDLKNMIHLAETDTDIDLVVQMTKKFNSQNKQLRFGSFVFGPVIMRMLHIYNKPDLALECFTSPELDGLFDQLITYQIFLDLLYENKMYEEVLKMFEVIKGRQLEGTKYPRNAVVLTMAACYKLNSEKSVEYALNLWKELRDAGHFPMRRATTFCAGLALNQGRPEVALEILSSVHKPNYVTIRNIKAKALSQIGRLDEALIVLKSIISDDQPGEVAQTFNRDVMECIKAEVLKTDNPEISLEFNRLEKLFEKEGHITDLTLDAHLCSEIQKPPIMNNRQKNRFSRYDPGSNARNFNNVRSRFPTRAGLKDMV